ncbi:MAG: inorganic phosphate transporter, partial [Phycisphaerae bacterium]|nr:inorganic phosphate transporter [Phycisphaerae bacterium]
MLDAASSQTLFLAGAATVAVGMLLWDTIEVGRNDAANLVNAIIGARILDRRLAVLIAGVAVILGATAATPVMETARKGIF